jgi:isopenicillin-N N-acyltransferase-like protein
MKVEPDLYSLTTDGSGEQIGRQYGSALSGEIADQVDRSTLRFNSMGHEHQRETAIRSVSETFRQYFPYLWDEIEGICSGSGTNQEAFLRHLFMSAVPVFKADDNGCTDVIFQDSDVGPLLGKTHDATSPDRALALVRVIRPHKGHAVLCLTRVDGLSTMTGLNNNGLAVGEASVHFRTSNKQGVVRNLLPRAILQECADVAEAVEFLAAHSPLRFGYQFALVDKAGNSAIVERSPTEQSVRWGSEGALFCTNHAATPRMRALEKSRGELGDRNSDGRFESLSRLVSGPGFVTTLESLMSIISSHDTFGGICQHGDPDFPGPKQEFYPMFTQRAFINIVQAGKLLVANGTPCKSRFHEFTLKG